MKKKIKVCIHLKKKKKVEPPEQGLEPWTLGLKVQCSTD
jgi:hypothetical protein